MALLKKAFYCIELTTAAEIQGWFGFIYGLYVLTSSASQNGYNNYANELEGGVLLISSACLIGGVTLKNQTLLVPWLSFFMLYLFSFNFVTFNAIFKQYAGEVLILSLIQLFFINLICGYLWLIVFTVYKVIDRTTTINDVSMQMPGDDLSAE